MMLQIEHTNASGDGGGDGGGQGGGGQYTFFSVSKNLDGTVNTDGYKKPMSTEYVRNYKKHWVLDASSLSFLREMYDEMETTATGTKNKKKKKKKKKKTTKTETSLKGESMAAAPSIAKTLCAACGKFSKAGDKPKKCSACRSVSYCNAICQKAHWKDHKLVCKKLCGVRE